MSYIKFNNTQSKINATVTPISSTIVEVDGTNKNDSGFSLYLNNGMLIGDYNNYTTVYRIIDIDTTQYSNDKSVYIEPIIIEPIVIEPTAEEVAEIERQCKIAEIQSQINMIDEQFKSLDYVGIKIATGRATKEEYVDEIVLMDKFASEKDLLEKELNQVLGVI